LAIEGVRDEANELPYDGNMNKWQTSGVFDESDGLLYLKGGD